MNQRIIMAGFNFHSALVKTLETGKGKYAFLSVVDVFDLKKIAIQLADPKCEREIVRSIQNLDTSVREMIPRTIFDFVMKEE